MKGQKARMIILAIVVFEFLLFFSLLSNSIAWKNNKLTGTFNPNDPNEVANWKSDHYGTHDWIAEAALDANLAYSVTKDEWKDSNGNSFWTDRRRIIFLVATEAPDTGNSPSDQKGYVRTTLNGITVGGIRSQYMHHLYFTHDENPRTEYSMRLWDTAMLGLINTYAPKVEKALKDGKCDLAAWYMGMIVHFVSDVAGWQHAVHYENDLYETWYSYTTNPRPSKSDVKDLYNDRHTAFEGDVLYYTNDYQQRKKFFSHPEIGKDGYNTIHSEHPWIVAVYVAFNTRFDCSLSSAQNQYANNIIPSSIQPGIHDAIWMFHHFEDKLSWSPTFKDCIQKELDSAVKASAEALHYFADYWFGYTDRKCVYDPTSSQDPLQTLKASRGLMIAIAVLVSIGLAMTLTLPFIHATAWATIKLPV